MKTKQLIILLLVTTLLTALPGLTALAAEGTGPSYEHALALKDRGILFGFPDGTFGLDRQLSRCQAVAILLRVLDLYDIAGHTAYKTTFSDVPEHHWAAPYILYACEKEMITGVSTTVFAPERYITAQEFCALLLRYMLNEPEIELDTVFGWIVTRTPLDLYYIEELFAKDEFTRADMVEIVYVMCMEESALPGGYTEDRDLTDEDLAVFEKALEGFVGVSYVPTAVATQVVEGINYRFTCTATVVYPNAEPYTAFVYIFQPLGDEAPELISIERAGEAED